MSLSHRTLAAVTGLALTAATLTACGSSDAESADDAQGAGGPERIVLTDYATASTLDVLDLEDRVAGITKGSTLPEALSVYASDDYTDVGTLKEPKMDVIAEIGPDLIVYSGRSEALVPEFEKLSDQVIAGGADTSDLLASNRKSVEEIAALFGPESEEKAGEELAEIDEKVAGVKEKAADAGTAIVLMTSGGKVSAYGAGSRFDFLFNELGMTPAGDIATEGRHGAPLSWEEIAELNPDHVFVVDRDSAIAAEGEAAAALLDNDIFKRTNAAKNDDVHYLNAQNWYLVTGGLSVLDAMVDEVDQAID